MTTTATSLDRIVDFLTALHSGFDPTDFDRDLIESRLLNSLALVEFLLLLQELSQIEIDLGKFDVDTVRTLRAIEAHYFQGDSK